MAGNTALELAQAERRRVAWRGGVKAAQRKTIRELADALEQDLRRRLVEKDVPAAYAAMVGMVDQANAILAKGGTPSREHGNMIMKTLALGGFAGPPARAHEDDLMNMSLADLGALIAKCEAEQKAHNATIEGETTAQAIEKLM